MEDDGVSIVDINMPAEELPPVVAPNPKCFYEACVKKREREDLKLELLSREEGISLHELGLEDSKPAFPLGSSDVITPSLWEPSLDSLGKEEFDSLSPPSPSQNSSVITGQTSGKYALSKRHRPVPSLAWPSWFEIAVEQLGGPKRASLDMAFGQPNVKSLNLSQVQSHLQDEPSQALVDALKLLRGSSTNESLQPPNQAEGSLPVPNMGVPLGASGSEGAPSKEFNDQVEGEYHQSVGVSDMSLKKPKLVLPCPRCDSKNTRFCYYNNNNWSMPRHFCRNCQRYWTAGGTERNVVVGAGRRKNKHAVLQEDCTDSITLGSSTTQESSSLMNSQPRSMDVPLLQSPASTTSCSQESGFTSMSSLLQLDSSGIFGPFVSFDSSNWFGSGAPVGFDKDCSKSSLSNLLPNLQSAFNTYTPKLDSCAIYRRDLPLASSSWSRAGHGAPLMFYGGEWPPGYHLDGVGEYDLPSGLSSSPTSRAGNGAPNYLHVETTMEQFRGTKECLNNDNIGEIANDATRSDHEFIYSLENKMEAITSIQVIDIEEVFSRPRDQSIFVLGFFNVSSDHIEFYFENGENMAKLVGVGLQHGKVVVKRGIIFEVREIEIKAWEKIWLEVKACSNTSFKIMKVTLPKTRDCIGNGKFEDGSHFATSSASANPLFQDHTFTVSDNTSQVPYLWELSKYFIMRRVIDAFYTKCNVGTWDECFQDKSMEDNPKDGNETDVTWFQTLKVLFSKTTVDSGDDNDGNRREEENREGDNGGGNGDGNGGDDNFHQSKSTVDLPKDKVEISQVNVILLSGGDFFERNMEPLSNRLPLSIERLNNVKITPELTFDFCKRKNTKKIQITTSVIFALDRDCDGIDSCGHFGWFHDEIHASFGPLDRNIQRTVYLKHDFKEGKSVPGKTTNKALASKETTKCDEKGFQIGGTFGSSQVARLGVGANVKQQVSSMDHRSNEQSLESQCNQTQGGFKIQPKPVMHEALLEYKYLAPYFEIVPNHIQDRKYRYDLSSHPMCNLQKTEFLGTWVPVGNDEVAIYIFKADRRLHEIRTEEVEPTSSSNSIKTLFRKSSREYLKDHVRSSLELPVSQAYQKQLYVNHAMTHLVDGETYTLLESSNSQIPYQNLDVPLIRFPILVDYQ